MMLVLYTFAALVFAAFLAVICIIYKPYVEGPNALTLIAKPVGQHKRHVILAETVLPTGDRLMILRTDLGNGYVYTAFYQGLKRTGGNAHAINVDPKRPAVIEIGRFAYQRRFERDAQRYLTVNLMDNPSNVPDPLEVKMIDNPWYSWGAK